MTKEALKQELRQCAKTAYLTIRPGESSITGQVYLGSYTSLDPCGRYHHALSPNGISHKCAAYWDRLATAAEETNGWLESGDTDGLDIYYCFCAVEEAEHCTINGTTVYVGADGMLYYGNTYDLQVASDLLEYLHSVR